MDTAKVCCFVSLHGCITFIWPYYWVILFYEIDGLIEIQRLIHSYVHVHM